MIKSTFRQIWPGDDVYVIKTNDLVEVGSVSIIEWNRFTISKPFNFISEIEIRDIKSLYKLDKEEQKILVKNWLNNQWKGFPSPME